MTCFLLLLRISIINYGKSGPGVVIVKLTKKETELLIKVFSFYYENYVWGTLSTEDSNRASDEDYEIRTLTQKLGIRELLPLEIRMRW